MPKEAKQSDNWKYQVRTVKLMKEDGTWSGLYANERVDTGHVFNDVISEKYGLIQNEELMEKALEALDAKGFSDFKQRVIVLDDGAKMYAEFTFQNKQLAMAVGDVFGYRLTLKNSFDRSLRQGFDLGFLRLTCLNGASTTEKEFSMAQKHFKNITTAMIGDAISHAIERGPKALETYDAMARAQLTDAQGQTVLKNLVARDILSEKLREAIELLWLNPQRSEDKARNLYNLYNAVTEHLTHKVDTEEGRYDYARRTSQNILLTLVNATRKAENFTKLITPIPEKVNTVTVIPSGPVIDVQ